MRRRAAFLLTLTIVGATAAATRPQQSPAPPATQPSSSQPPSSQPAASQPAAHSTQRLGMRSANVAHSIKLIDRVVLVPDAATYTDEIRKWTPAGRWPVLIEDDLLTPLFVRRFKPAEVIRREALVAPLPAETPARRKYIEDIVVASLGGDPAKQTIAQLFDASKYQPPGVVVASTDDPAWTAALALAAGHAQPIIWIDDDLGPVDGVMDDAAARSLSERIGAGMDALLYACRELGDTVDAITLCRNAPVAAAVNLPDDQRLIRTGQFADGPVALTDFLGRDVDGRRYAYTGWIFGDEVRCAYMAMCSLFLPRESVALFNTYGKDGEFGSYAITEAQQLFGNNGYQVQAADGADMSEAGWGRLIAGGLSADAAIMNSSGNADFFALSGGNARPGDVPVLNQPLALHLIHSWSLRAPTRGDTVGGRWLQHGAYAMVGSCYEPFLASFHRPATLARRCAGAVPFLIAARRWPEDGFAMPWRIVTIGDPLMLLSPPAGMNIARLAKPAGYGENLLDRARTLMKKADADGDVNAFAEAIGLLDMLNQDQIALQMWTLAQQKGLHSGRIASAILPALFRARDAEGFIAAWNEGGPRSPIMFDMLWHLMGPRLGGAIDGELLLMLEAAVRTDAPAHDAARLAPALERVFGKDHVRQFLQREIARTQDAEQQRQLREIESTYP